MRNLGLVAGGGRTFEADARQLVPVDDEIGGTALYLGGRVAYYVLNGEWFEAVKIGADASLISLPGSVKHLPSSEIKKKKSEKYERNRIDFMKDFRVS